jgi:hypothetical protein
VGRGAKGRRSSPPSLSPSLPCRHRLLQEIALEPPECMQFAQECVRCSSTLRPLQPCRRPMMNCGPRWIPRVHVHTVTCFAWPGDVVTFVPHPMGWGRSLIVSRQVAPPQAGNHVPAMLLHKRLLCRGHTDEGIADSHCWRLRLSCMHVCSCRHVLRFGCSVHGQVV